MNSHKWVTLTEERGARNVLMREAEEAMSVPPAHMGSRESSSE